MYETFFELRERPFAAAPLPGRYFPGTNIEATRQTLARCIERAEGIGLVIGPSGTGKTLLCQVLAEQFKNTFAVAILSSGRLATRRALLQAILFELGRPYRRMEEGELRLALIDYLTPSEECPHGLLLLIDEAHTLPLRLLEEIRMITNLVRGGQPRVRVVLAGGPALEERLASPRLESFSQRIVARCYLQPFDRAQTCEYLRAQIAAVSGDAERIFTPEAMASVHRATEGIPRLVNQVCDHALLLAYAGGCRNLTPAAIEEAWADLQQLPAPWSEPGECEKTAEGGVIEFGGLEDEGEESSVAHFPSGEAQPAARLAEIEERLDELDEEFEPAGSIGPEVELAFPEFQHPFREKFAEEEVVIDRYVAPDNELWRESPRVRDRQGGELSRMLQSVSDQMPSEPSVRVAPATQPSEPPRLAAVSKETPSTVSVQGGAETAAETEPEPVDENLILVEEGATEEPAVHRVVPVRQREYRQLFAKLRRG
ncbi:MAG: ExeA family protein [Pirellulales bacterium]